MTLEIKKIPLQEKLQKAIELELATIPPYLMAMFSIKPNTNVDAAVIIRSVFMEEMLHMLLAANILSATGGSVKLGQDNIPEYPCRLTFKGENFTDRDFNINLEAFSKNAIDIFMQIELPQQPKSLKKARDIIIEGYTIGEFYLSIAHELADLCKEFGEQNVFNGNSNNQVSEQYYWGGGGKPIVVTSLQTAEDAIRLIVEQGEGAMLSSDKLNFFAVREEVPHYYRFKEIYLERYYAPEDDKQGEPTGERMEIDYSSVYPIRPNCKGQDFAAQPDLKLLNDLFNTNYSMMLHQLEEGFNGNPKVFYTAIMNGMRNLSPIARQIVQIPMNGDNEGRHASPTFEWLNPTA